MADTVITFGNDTEGAQFIFGDDGKLGVGAHLCGDGNSYSLSKTEARFIASQILDWAS